MKRPLFLAASFSLAAITTPAIARPPTPAPLPPLPAGNAAAGDASQPTADTEADAQRAATPGPAGPLSPQQVYEHVRRGVVALERNGVPMAIGTVLDGDGRILTSLSGLGGTDTADVRYADGTSVHAKVGHSDKSTDLALLVPQSGKWTDGLAASEADPLGAPLSAMLPSTRSARLGPAEAGVKGRVDAHSRDGATLPSMLDVDIKGPLIAGAPLLDATGTVVAVLVRACKGASAAAAPSQASADAMPWAAWANQKEAAAKTPAACTPVILGAPVTAIRSFLSATPAAPAPPAAWLGIRGEPAQDGSVRGVRVVAVAPSSPAEKGGLKPTADVIVAADGKPIDTPEKLSDLISKHAPGDTVKLLVFGEGKFREAPVALRQAP